MDSVDSGHGRLSLGFGTTFQSHKTAQGKASKQKLIGEDKMKAVLLRWTTNLKITYSPWSL
jgi:hypothetical protein